MAKIVVANWKMNPETLFEARKLATLSLRNVPRGVELVLCPPSLFFIPIADGNKAKKRSLGVQNIFYEPAGAYTGEISAKMAYESGARFALIGHSERRRLGEGDADVAKKLAAAIKAKLTPILCIGEKERDSGGAYLNVLREQIKNSLAGISKGVVKKIIIAYEPIFAIGKKADDAMSAQTLHETVIFIRKILVDNFGNKAREVKILYGGSVAPENALEIVKNGKVDGLLVGHQSLNPEFFRKIMEEVARA